MKIAKQLDQDVLPIICDKGVSRILIDVYHPMKDEFQIVIQMLGRFYAAKCVQHCIEKYIQGFGIERTLRQTKVFCVNVADTVLYGINYKRSFKGYFILVNAIEKWDAFLKTTDINPFDGLSDAIKSLQIAFVSKNFENSKLTYETCSSRCELIKQEFRKF